MIETQRLVLRGWRPTDLEPFHAMGQDPEVMTYLGPAYDWDGAVAMIDRQNALLAEHGHCFWALESKRDGAFLGFCGVKPQRLRYSPIVRMGSSMPNSCCTNSSTAARLHKANVSFNCSGRCLQMSR